MPRSGLDTAQADTPRSCKWVRTPFQPALSANAPCTSSTVGLEELSGDVVMCTLRGCWPRASSRGMEPAPCLGGNPEIIGQPTARGAGLACPPPQAAQVRSHRLRSRHAPLHAAPAG